MGAGGGSLPFIWSIHHQLLVLDQLGLLQDGSSFELSCKIQVGSQLEALLGLTIACLWGVAGSSLTHPVALSLL